VFFSEHSVIADIGLLEPTYFMTVDQALDLTALMFMALAVSERVSYDYYSSRKRVQQSKKNIKSRFLDFEKRNKRKKRKVIKCKVLETTQSVFL